MNTDLWRNVFKFMDPDSCEVACEVFGKSADRAFEQAVCIVIVDDGVLKTFTCRTKANEYYDEHAAKGQSVQMRDWRFTLEKETGERDWYW